ncbi:MAG: uracil-DNA glycosylase [Patescibacteria group bacterium]
MHINIESSWKQALSPYLHSPEFEKTIKRVQKAYTEEQVFPAQENIFTAFNLCPFNAVRVVILGQDPYHNPGQAMGLSFSVPNNVALPPSLQNIYKEISGDIGKPSQNAPQGDLTSWAKQGVLLLNSVLTVRAHEAGSHQDMNWQSFTDEAIAELSNKREHIVFMLWGNYAQSKVELIDRSKHLILIAPHPSPLSAHRGFFGSKHFSQCNQYLLSHNITPILW